MYFDQQTVNLHAFAGQNQLTLKKLFPSLTEENNSVSEDGKSCFSIKKLIVNSERLAEHPFADQNTQQAMRTIMQHPLIQKKN